MDINKYIYFRYEDIKHFFLRISFENIGTNKQIVDKYFMFNEDLKDLDIINADKEYRNLTDTLLLKIHYLLVELNKRLTDITVENNLINFNNKLSEAEKATLTNDTLLKPVVDKLVTKFLKEVINEVEKTKKKIMEDFCLKNNISEENKKYLFNNLPKLEDFTIQIGSDYYDYKRDIITKEKNEKLETVDDFRIFLLYLFTLPQLAKEKINNPEKNNPKDFQNDLQYLRKIITKKIDPIISQYITAGSEQHQNFIKYFHELTESKNYEQLKKSYDDIEKFVIEITGKNIVKLLDENNLLEEETLIRK